MGVYRPKNILTKEFLIEEYINKDKTNERLQKEFNFSSSTLFRYLKKFNLQKNKLLSNKITIKLLKEQYINQEKSATQIAQEMNCSCDYILKKLREYNIPVKTAAIIRKKMYYKYGDKHSFLTKEYLYNQYVTLGNNMYVIAKKHNLAVVIVFRRLKLYKIPTNLNAKTGKNNSNWQGGISFEEYGAEFDNALKEQVRFRDNYKCQECGCSQLENGRQLDCHHIDYDKLNNILKNLIALCRKCHTKTNYNREYWIQYFKEVYFGL